MVIMFLRDIAAALQRAADSIEQDPTGRAIEDAAKGALTTFAEALHGTQPAQPVDPAPVPPTVIPPASSPAGTATGGAASTATTNEVPAPSAAELLSSTPTLYKCPECGRYYTEPTTCAVEHPAAATVTLDEVPAPTVVTADDADTAAKVNADAAPAAGPETPDWPAGS